MMASGEVAKKIALFELKPKNHEHHCRLKRKHAIRRKRYRGKERRLVTHEGASMIALSTSDEHLNLLVKSSDEDSCSSSYHQSCSSQFSASCSALFDLVSASESSEFDGTLDDDSSLMEIIPHNKRLFLKSATCKEKKLTKRLNIIDIDIEIKIEKKEMRTSSPVYTDGCFCDHDQRNPLVGSEKINCSIKKGTIAVLTPSVALSAERIRLTACVDDSCKATKNKSSNSDCCIKCSHDAAETSKTISKNNRLNELVKNGSNNSTKYDEKLDNGDKNATTNRLNSSPEPLYENILCFTTPPPLPPLGPPPLPPKRLFGDSFTTNYSCLPATLTKNNTALSLYPKRDKLIFEDSTTSCAFKSTENPSEDIDVATLTLNTRPTGSTEPINDCSSTIDNTRSVTELSGKPLLPCLEKIEPVKPSSTKQTRSKSDEIHTNGKSYEQENSVEPAGDDSDEEPYYEDLYDYCNRSLSSGGLNPILDLFRDQFHSIEQNVEDEVEYCDCSTILALMTTDSGTNENASQEQLNKIHEHHRDQCLNKSYEIYDDCFGLETPTGQEMQIVSKTSTDKMNDTCPQGVSVIRDNNCEIYGDRNVSNNERSSVSNQSAGLTASHTLTDYIRAKVAKASTPISWRKMSSPAADRGLTEQCTQSDVHPMSPLATSSTLFAIFPSLSSSKKKLIEAEREATVNKENSRGPQDILQKEATIHTQSNVENERNVDSGQNERNQEVKTNALGSYDAYGIFNYAKNNGNGIYTSSNKPKFGGRPVIAHPADEENAQRDDPDEQRTQGEDGKLYQNSQNITKDGQPHYGNKKDDNEIFNKPLPLPPPNASTYESLYEEPIYGITNQLTATYSEKSGGAEVPSGKRRSSAPAAPPPFATNKLPNNLSLSKPGSTYSHSPSISSGSTYGYSSGSVNEYGETSSKYGPSSCQTVNSTASSSALPLSPTQTNNANPDSIYGVNDKLPPTPPSKFSSIAKTAGRKIAKKFLGIRRTSKCGLDEPLSVFNQLTNAGDSSDSGTCQSPSIEFNSSNGSTPQPVASIYSPSNSSGKAPNGYINNSQSTNHYGGSTGSGVSGAQIRRPISRPSIPPPEPPKNDSDVGPVVPPVLPDKVNNYSIYADNKNDDDYDDSDFYDSDSELIRNFVSQVQPIYSMEEEPLYQYYTYGISLKPDDDYQPVIPKNLGLTLDMLVPRVGQRTLWCELPGVVSSGILSILSDKQKQLQEAIFEILTSEVSYLKSLDVLISLFCKNEELLGILSEEERAYLFGNIDNVRDCSQAFLSELLGKWEESWYIQEIGEIISRNTETRFSVYKEYCRNKPYQDKTMQRLRHTRDEFIAVVKAIEEDSRCQMLQIDSFLMLPMQRITRLPLLVNAVIQRTAAGKEKNKCEEALKCLTNLVLACNDAARESQDAEETMAILDKLEFTRGIRSLPDLGAFIMKGDFMKNPFDQGRGNQINWTFRKTKRTFYWLFLFSKQLLVARKKANGRFEIIDMIDPAESSIKPLPNLEGVSKEFKHFFMLHFNRKETVYFLAAKTNSEVERWKSKLEAMKPKEELRVEAIFPYDARRPDEMSFYVGDVIRVSQIQPDGWYHGTKLATGESGWFPGNYCCENAS